MADTVMIVDTGLEITVDALLALGASAPAYIQWGVGTTAPAVGNTGIEDTTNATESRTTGTDSKQNGDSTGDTYRVVGTITKTGSGATIAEVVLMDGAGSGNPPTGDTCFLRATFSGIALSVGNAIEFTIDTKYAQG